MHVEPPHGLVVGVVEPVLEGHRHLEPAPQVPQPHGPTQVVGVRQAGEDADALVRESLEWRRRRQSTCEADQKGALINNRTSISLPHTKLLIRSVSKYYPSYIFFWLRLWHRVVSYSGTDFGAVSDGGEPLLAGRDDVEGGDVVPDGEEARVVLSEVRRQEDLEPRAVDDVAVQPRVVVVHLRNSSFIIIESA